jgi:hypothetical protein
MAQAVVVVQLAVTPVLTVLAGVEMVQVQLEQVLAVF